MRLSLPVCLPLPRVFSQVSASLWHMVTCSHVKMFSTSLVNFWQPLLFYRKNISRYFEVVGGNVPLLKIVLDILSPIHYLFNQIFCSYDSINPSNFTSVSFWSKYYSEPAPFAPFFYIFPLPLWKIQENFPHLRAFWRYGILKTLTSISEVMISVILKNATQVIFFFFLFISFIFD